MKLKKIIPQYFMLLIVCISLNSCKKELPLITKALPDSKITVNEAKAWLKLNKPDLNLDSNWNHPTFIDVKNGTEILKIRINETLYKKKTWVIRDVLFQRDISGKIQAIGYKVFVDASYFTNKYGANQPLADKRSFISDTDFTGKVVFYTLNNHALMGWKYSNGKIQSNLIISIKSSSPLNAIAGNPSVTQPLECTGEALDDHRTCQTSGGDEPFDGGSNGHPLKEVPITAPTPNWTYLPTNPANNPPPGSIPVGNPGTGGSNGSTNSISSSELAAAIPFDNGKSKIKDIKKYTDCFNDGKEAKNYTMTIYVNQPVPGKNDWYKVVRPGVSSNNSYGVPTGIIYTRPDGTYFDVGHTFVNFEKNNTDGTNVRQTLGFYPSSNPLSSKGAMEDNGGHDADVSYTMNVTKEQFQAGLKKVESDFASKDYILTNATSNEYNCTDAAISWMNAAGANFENSSSGLFKNTPGNFGQVLKSKSGANLYPGKGIFGKGPCN